MAYNCSPILPCTLAAVIHSTRQGSRIVGVTLCVSAHPTGTSGGWASTNECLWEMRQLHILNFIFSLYSLIELPKAAFKSSSSDLFVGCFRYEQSKCHHNEKVHNAQKTSKSYPLQVKNCADVENNAFIHIRHQSKFLCIQVFVATKQMCISWSKIPTWLHWRYVEVDMCVWVGTGSLNKDYQGTETSLHNCTEAMPRQQWLWLFFTRALQSVELTRWIGYFEWPLCPNTEMERL